jgi:hypothetical protein
MRKASYLIFDKLLQWLANNCLKSAISRLGLYDPHRAQGLVNVFGCRIPGWSAAMPVAVSCKRGRSGAFTQRPAPKTKSRLARSVVASNQVLATLSQSSGGSLYWFGRHGTRSPICRVIVVFDRLESVKVASDGVRWSPGLRGRQPRGPSKHDEYWRPRPESNRGARICSPLRNHSATRPTRAAGINVPVHRARIFGRLLVRFGGRR